MLHKKSLFESTEWSADGPTGSRTLRNRDWSPLLRLATVVIALAILYLRMPTSFTNPQFWGEDIIFFDEARFRGWASLLTAPAGYLVVAQVLIAILASYFSPIAAPAIFNYAAVLLTLLTVWLVTSPRLAFPLRYLAAIAIVVVPMGYEELGTITNIQWILPIGVFALLFMRASSSPIVLAGEALLSFVMAVSGPFCIFLLPLFLLRLISEQEKADRRRFTVLSAIIGLGVAVQITCILVLPDTSKIEPAAYDWRLWINLPFSQWMTTFGSVSKLFRGVQGVVLGSALLLLALIVASMRPYRTQKLFMLFFALMIAIAGMYKFRLALGTQHYAQRYFYAGSIFALWFICCLSDRRYLRTAAATVVALIELALLPVVANTPRITRNLDWPIWASYLSSGLPTIIPSSPDSWYLVSPAPREGSLAKFASWINRPFGEISGPVDPSYCAGTMGPIQPLLVSVVQNSQGRKELGPTWISRGSAWDGTADRPVQLVALVDQTDRVIGFGFPGFSTDGSKSPRRSGWTSIFSAEPGKFVRAYGIVEDGKRLCLLDNERYFPQEVRPLASSQFIGGLEIQPAKDLVQLFRPIHRLEGVTAKFVTWGKRPTRYTIHWQIMARSHNRVIELGAGSIESDEIGDWSSRELPVSIVPREVPEQIEIAFRTDHDTTLSAPVGLPVYRPLGESTAPPAETGGIPYSSGGVIGMDIHYAN